MREITEFLQTCPFKFDSSPGSITMLSAIVSTPVQGKTRMSMIKRLRCFVVGCNNSYISCHLLPTSEPLKTQKINVIFVLKGMRPRST